MKKQFKFTLYTSNGDVMDWTTILAVTRKEAHEIAQRHLVMQGWRVKLKYNLRRI